MTTWQEKELAQAKEELKTTEETLRDLERRNKNTQVYGQQIAETQLEIQKLRDKVNVLDSLPFTKMTLLPHDEMEIATVEADNVVISVRVQVIGTLPVGIGVALINKHGIILNTWPRKMGTSTQGPNNNGEAFITKATAGDKFFLKPAGGSTNPVGCTYSVQILNQ